MDKPTKTILNDQHKESLIKAIEYYLSEFRSKKYIPAKHDLYKDIGYSEEFHKSIVFKEENLIDRINFLYRKEIRKMSKQKIPIDASELFMMALLSEEGLSFIRCLEEHIDSRPMVYFCLCKVYEQFESRYVWPVIQQKRRRV